MLSPDPRRNDGTPLIPPANLIDQIRDKAEVAVFTDPSAARTLRTLIPNLKVWGGAARIIHVGASLEDAKNRHPLITVSSSGSDHAIAEIQRWLHRTPASRATGSTTGTGRPEARSREMVTDQADTTAHLRSLLAEERQTNSGLRRENRQLRRALAAAQQAADAAAPAVYADPEQQFRYEVEQCWLRHIPEAERADWPLAPYTLGPDWLASLRSTQLVERRKILDVTVEILTALAATIPGRQVHRMRAREERGGNPLVRADQAVAMRCHLKNQTAAAPRLMWWRLPDQSIELGRVASHDDTYLR
ncbi:hypothetical protein [Streptomyces californicus]|uniref:hypothetical protein n=1 Tax=Streptomyces californicus TaxID=67351 RepID=UPI00296F58D3|nr:hypothetical protein [Streptomyces californicus]MDW4912641.1 hypothetical protein [Streptomyces californicus]